MSASPVSSLNLNPKTLKKNKTAKPKVPKIGLTRVQLEPELHLLLWLPVALR